MNRIVMKFALAALMGVLVAPTAAGAAIVTQWTFNTNPSDGAANTGTSVSETGTGVISPIGGVNQSFAQGSGNDGSPTALDGNNNSSLNTFNYPAVDQGNLTAGIEIAVDTRGYEDIVLSFEHLHASGASRSFSVEYSTDGVDYTQISGYDAGTSPNIFHLRSVDFATTPSVDNNLNFRVRIVAEFFNNFGYRPPGGPNYLSSADNRFDLVTISGTPIPEPATPTLLLGGSLAVALLRRARRASGTGSPV